MKQQRTPRQKRVIRAVNGALCCRSPLSVHSAQLHAYSLSRQAHTLYKPSPVLHLSLMMPYSIPNHILSLAIISCSRSVLSTVSHSNYLSLSSKRNKAPSLFRVSRLVVKWRRPTLPRVCSTIGAVGLNFSVRNGKRWNPVAITTGNIS